MKKIFIVLLILLSSIGSTYLFATQLNIAPIKNIDIPITLVSPTDTIYLKLNRLPLFKQLIKIKINPPVDGMIGYNRNEKELHFGINIGQFYEYDQKYEVSFIYFGKDIGSITLLGPNKPSVAALAKNDAIITANYRLAAYLPYETNQVYVKYKSAKTLLIKIKEPRIDGKKIVNDFAASKGVDISDHQFILE
jgi:hypothetical protein